MTTTIEYDLKEVLTDINKKLDNLSSNVNELKVDIATIKSEIATVKTDLKEVKGSQKNQIWTLILLALTAVVGLVFAIGKFIFFPNL